MLKRNPFSCNECGVPYSHQNILYPRNCQRCNLVPVGKYPVGGLLSLDNILFLQYVDKLKQLECFKKWRSEGINISGPRIHQDYFLHEFPENK